MEKKFDKFRHITDVSTGIIAASSQFANQPNLIHFVNTLQAIQPLFSRSPTGNGGSGAENDNFLEETGITHRQDSTPSKRKSYTNRNKTELESKENSNNLSETNDSNNQLQCPICYENAVNNSAVVTTCGHVFCRCCIMQALILTKKCPVCKQKQVVRNLIKLHS